MESEERFGDGEGDGSLLPEEESAVTGAAEARRREYTLVRSCARACLARLGHAPVAIPRTAGGAPAWPTGVVGSMTHCAGYAAAAVAAAQRVSAIGIDAEPDAPLPDGVLDLVATAAERARLPAPHAPDAPCWDRLLFCAKEAVFKAWYPLVGEWLEYAEAEVVLHADAGTLTAQLRRDGMEVDGHPVTLLSGRWTRRRGILLTSVVLTKE